MRVQIRRTPPGTASRSWGRGRGAALCCDVRVTETSTDDDRLVRFARIVAHGMRNPLAIATGMLDLLDRQVGDDLDDELRELLRRSSDAIRRAGDQLLGLQRYTGASRDPLVPEALDLGEVVDDVLLGLGEDAGVVVAEPDLPRLVADRRAVERALRELLDNALRHASDLEHRPRIHVGGEVEGDVVVLRVDDDGPGIPEDRRAEAMTEGERLGKTGDGFGLGLPVARVLLRRHGGEVRLADSPLGGLRVELRWPAVALLGEEGAQG